jgi:hypothetical protein
LAPRNRILSEYAESIHPHKTEDKFSLSAAFNSGSNYLDDPQNDSLLDIAVEKSGDSKDDEEDEEDEEYQ